MKYIQINGDDFPRAYGVIHNDETVRMSSQSGGLFYGLADLVIKSGGIVYGCAYSEGNSVKHIRINDSKTISTLQGSKYVQSEMGINFNKVLVDLHSGLLVLFSGTSCQVAGLLSYLEQKKCDNTNLITCDIVCHGVPSPLIYQEFISYIETKRDSKITFVNLRDKVKYGWRTAGETYKFTDNSELSLKLFTELFYSNLILRPSCSCCKYTNYNKPSDITMADFWGIERFCPGFHNDNLGVSLAIIQSTKGMKIFETGNFDKIGINIKEYYQPNLVCPTETPYQRLNFWKDYKNRGFRFVLVKYTSVGGVKFKIKRKILRFFKLW